MPPKNKKSELKLNDTDSEPSALKSKASAKKSTRSATKQPQEKVAAAEPKKRPEHVPKEWGQPGEGGYFAFQKEYLAKQAAELGEKFVRKEAMTQAGVSWKEKDPKWKWQTYGAAPAAPPKPPSEFPAGNFFKYKSEYRNKQKEAGKTEGAKDADNRLPWDVEAKRIWDKMDAKARAAYALPELTEEQKAERAKARAAKKAAKLERAKEEKTEKKRAASAKPAKSSKAEPASPRKGRKSATPTKKAAGGKASAKSVSKSPTGAKGKQTKAQKYKAVWEKHYPEKVKDAFDVPIKQLLEEGKTKTTTFNKVIKSLKCALVVNTASKCGHTKRHFSEMVKLQAEFGDKGFSVLAFPSPEFSQEPLDDDDLLEHHISTHGVNFPMFEKIMVNDVPTHPIFQRLKEDARGGKGIVNIPWNFDKFLITVTDKGKRVEVIEHGTAKAKKPSDFAEQIGLLVK